MTLAVLALLVWVVAVIWALCAGSEENAPVENAQAARIGLNSADAEELQALPGVGPVLSGRIVEERERLGFFRGADDLLRVRGVTRDLVQRLRPLVEVAAPPGRRGRTDQGDAGATENERR